MKVLFANDIKYLKVSGQPNDLFIPIKQYVEAKSKQFRYNGKIVPNFEIWDSLKNIQQQGLTVNSDVELGILNDLTD